MKEFTQEQFYELITETIPCALFHVQPTDIDDDVGCRYDELRLIQILNEYPEALRYRSLVWFIEYFIDRPIIPNDAHSFEVFSIKDCKESYSEKQAFIGYKISNGNFYTLGVPFTEPK